MNNLFVQIISGIVEAILVAWLGIGRKVKIVHAQGVRIKKNWKMDDYHICNNDNLGNNAV